jgi:hypothetical protein
MKIFASARDGAERKRAAVQLVASMSIKIQSNIFAVCDRAYCGWDPDFAENNVSFINGVDEAYFDFIARIHQPHLQGEDAQRAAIALQANYYLSLETLFGLIGAALQAPHFIPGWILKASTAQVRALTKALCHNRMEYPVPWTSVPQLLDFNFVTGFILRSAPWDADIVERFATLWQRLAGDFLDPHAICEYNSIKHGFRAKSGGFNLSYRIENPNVQNASEIEMKSLGGSTFGSTFYEAVPIKDAPEARNDPHFTLHNHSRNWYPDDTIGRMRLASMSIKNVKSFLLITNGVPPDKAEFVRPLNVDNFDHPWQPAGGVSHFSSHRTLREEHIERFSRDQLDMQLKSIHADATRSHDQK